MPDGQRFPNLGGLLRAEMAPPPAANLIKALLREKSSVNKRVKSVHILPKVIPQTLENRIVNSLVPTLREDNVDVVLK